MITKPLLPPKAGYAEVEIDGRRTYRNVKTGELIDNETHVPTDLELTQQDITDLQLADIEQGQAVTDLELRIMEGKSNV